MRFWNNRQTWGSILFWAHFFFIIGAIVSGFFLPLPLVIALILLHKMHLILWGDCLLTTMKRQLGIVAPHEDFIQYAARYVWNLSVTKNQSEIIQWGIYAITLLVTGLAHYI
ncbi:MAG: hypothetical protein G01um101466_500 [Parcubacteria group bacterium Gr01-1014_66]|nr:MAG: hypothetical protein G01um101466_500 [Parcubacteria group bacterium Gr01-1014_66]